MAVAYIFDEEIGDFYFGDKHPMKPHRVTFTHSLVHSYELDKHFDVFSPKMMPIEAFHGPNFLRNYISNNVDCPNFYGIEEYAERLINGSLTGAKLLIGKEYDMVINWGGGMHHAGKHLPSGFCYGNDIVVSILEMLKYYERVMYVDIDIHHGDAVEEAFYCSNRVFTLSFHKYGDDFFPKTGSLCNVGEGEGLGYACNVPLKTGITDEHYEYIFKNVLDRCITKINPDIIVLQCGADSLQDDLIGCFNVSIAQHGRCVDLVRSYNKPMLVLGGGGYTPKNVSRCWAYDTSVLLGQKIPNEIPQNDLYYDHYGPEYVLHPKYETRHRNVNTKEFLDSIIGFVNTRMDQI